MNLYDVVYESQGNWMETMTVEADSPEEAMAKADAAEDVVDVRYHAHDTQDRTYDRMEGGNPTPPPISR